MPIRNLFLFVSMFLIPFKASADINDLWTSRPDTLFSNSGLQIEYVSDVQLNATVSSSLDVQIKLLPAEDDNSIICLICTYSAPDKESVIRYYNKNWRMIGEQHLTLKDVIGMEKAKQFASYFEPLLISAKFIEQENSIILTVCDKFLGDDDKKQLKSLDLQTKVKWNKEMCVFN